MSLDEHAGVDGDDVERLDLLDRFGQVVRYYAELPSIASAALRWYDVVIPRDAISALDPFDLESSLRQTVFLFAGSVTTAACVRV